MRKNTAVGLDVGTRAVHIVELSTRKEGVELTNFGSAGLPHGAAGEGEVLDQETVTEAITDLLDEMGLKAKTTEVWVGVSNQRVVVRSVDLPSMGKKDFYDALPLQVDDYLSMDAAEAELDFVPTDMVGDGDRVRGLLIAVLKSTVSGAVNVVTNAGLQLGNVDINSLALLRTLTTGKEEMPTSEAVIDIGAGITDIVVHEHGIPRFIRVLPVGGMDISEALASGLGVDLEEAENIKVAHGVGSTEDDAATRIIDGQVETFVRRVNESLAFHISQTDTPPERVLLSGGAALLPGLAERLSDILELPVEFARPLSSLDVSTDDWDEEQLAAIEPVLTTATGLALGALRSQGVQL